ncbi:hypothetical protein BHE74_00056704 [Ensete ventricosum]|nr:hypothetical protein BHE74_00056704 [Ensete ventricosum]
MIRETLILPREIVYPCIPNPDGKDEGGQASSSLAWEGGEKEVVAKVAEARLGQSTVAVVVEARLGQTKGAIGDLSAFDCKAYEEDEEVQQRLHRRIEELRFG